MLYKWYFYEYARLITLLYEFVKWGRVKFLGNKSTRLESLLLKNRKDVKDHYFVLKLPTTPQEFTDELIQAEQLTEYQKDAFKV